MDAIETLAVACLVLGPIVTGLVWLVTRSRLALGVFAVIAVLDALWWIDVVLIARDYKDLDGLIDCYPYCNREQEVAAVVLFYTPLAMAIVLVGSLAVIASRLLRAQRGPRHARGSAPPAASRR